MALRAVVLGIFAASASVYVQAQAPGAAATGQSGGTKVSIEGCIQRAQRDGSVGGTGLGTTSSPNTADRDANSSETLDVFQLTDAERMPTDSAETGRTSYGLDGNVQELGKHTGHRVQVTGTIAPPRSAGEGTSSAAKAGISRIRVEAVKTISAECKPAAPR
jgi:hypothetical protein